MLKKTLLETSPLKQKNENTPIKAGGLRIPTKSSLEMNKQLYRQRESPQKTSSPSSQQDTTSDSLIRTSINDANKNIANLHRKDISELLTQNHLDVDKQGKI